jgi:hypothetical protein
MSKAHSGARRRSRALAVPGSSAKRQISATASESGNSQRQVMDFVRLPPRDGLLRIRMMAVVMAVMAIEAGVDRFHFLALYALIRRCRCLGTRTPCLNREMPLFFFPITLSRDRDFLVIVSLLRMR